MEIKKNMCYITDNEIWKDIPGYEGKYQASTHGRIRSLNYRGVKGKIQVLKLRKDDKGYLRVTICNNNSKMYLVHRLIAITFVANPYNYPEVNHIDENTLNNHYTNLEWCTREYNNNYGTHNERMAKSKSIPILCINLGLVYPSAAEAGRILNMTRGNINKCCKNILHHTHGYQFRYLTEEELNIYNNSNQEIYQLYEYTPLQITYDRLVHEYFNGKTPIYCMTNNTIYPSAAEAGRILWINHSHITSCCTGNRNHTGGYQFRYLTEEEIINYLKISKRLNMCNIIK